MDVLLQKYRGGVALSGSGIDDLATASLRSSVIDTNSFSLINPREYHITLLTKDELRTVALEKLASLTSELDTRHIFSLGIGGKSRGGVYWVVIIWAVGQQIRKQLGLPPKHFHITLSSSDEHDIDKGIESLLSPVSVERLSGGVLDHAIVTFQAFGKYYKAKEYALQFASQELSAKGFLRLADAAFSVKEFKLAMLSYACAWERLDDGKPLSYCFKKLIQCSRETEWGHVFQEEEIDQLNSLPTDLSSSLIAPWSEGLRVTLSEQQFRPSLLLESRQSLFVPSSQGSGFYKLPRFFRWLIPYHFAIMSTPRNEDDITALSSPHLAIRKVLTLTEETPLSESWFRRKRITNTFLPVANYCAPSIEQMNAIMQLFSDQGNLPLLVHCGGGKGRAGTVAACYLAACGFSKPSFRDHPEMSAADAISALRSLRPGSLETSRQEVFVSRWCSMIWKRQSIYPDIPSEPSPCPLEIEGTFQSSEGSNFFVLVGLPGSGKTWFSKSLLARNSEGWVHISQDETGSRAFCETAVGRAPKKGQRALLDRCNTSDEDRKQWVKLASNWCISPVCVWFDYPATLCTSRAQMRVDHPTLMPGGRVRSAVKQMQQAFVRPTIQEGWKAIFVVRSFEAAQEGVRRLSTPPLIYKFPRTPHLINVGAATDDDLHTDLAAFSSLVSTSCQGTAGCPARIVVTEKIDGANMGLSLSSSRDRIVVQNRSHYVNSSSHEQFRKLDAWIDRHNEGLRQILDRDPYFAERYILFGEWVYATHSIAYSHLPDWLLVYDLYDRSTKTFTDSQGLKALLEGTNICTVPVLFEGDRMPTKEELLGMIQRRSQFYDGRVEGVYVKVEENGWVRLRGKVVRSDFIAGNEHWSRGIIRANELTEPVHEFG